MEINETIYIADGPGLTGSGWFWICLIPLVIGFLGSEFAMWKSARLSPEAIKRRCYWAGVSGFLVCLLLSQMPDWKEGSMAVGLFGFSFVVLAFFRSSHIKIGDTIYAAWPSYRRPDRPPALSKEARD